MYIHEAVKKALDCGGFFTRKDYIEEDISVRYIRYKPIDRAPIRAYFLKGQIEADERHHWNPKSDELMADDWVVFSAENQLICE